MRILLAEDTRDLNRNITMFLRHEHYDVDSAFDGAAALDCLRCNSYDCVILDIMMPKVDGLTVLRDMRRRSLPEPVLLLTAKAEVDNRVIGLESGADDYLCKPFALKELLARVRALTRRPTIRAAGNLQVADVCLDLGTLCLSSASSVRLSGKEAETMQMLMCNTDRPLSTECLLDRVWHDELDAQTDTVWLYIAYLRQKLRMIGAATTIVGDKRGPFRLQEGACK